MNAPVARTASLMKAKPLHNRIFQVEELIAGHWVPAGALATFEVTAFLNAEKLHNVGYHEETHSLSYSFGEGGDHKAARLFFSQDHRSFAGTLTRESRGDVVGLRGSIRPSVYATERSMGNTESWKPFDDFELGTVWDDDLNILRQHYRLGDRDVSDRTSVVAIDNWQTTIRMIEGDDFESQDTFDIVVSADGTSFKGTYVDLKNDTYFWRGEIRKQSRAAVIADLAAYRAFDTPSPPVAPRAEARSAQELLNISCLETATVGGQTTVVDVAQTKTGTYFQYMLMNATEKPYGEEFFGNPKPLTREVERIAHDYERFFRDKSVVNCGQLIYDTFSDASGGGADAEVAKRIDIGKIGEAWRALGTDSEYGKMSQRLYIEGYRDSVTSIKPYLDDGEYWGTELHKLLTSQAFLNVWAVQVASAEFKNIKLQMYEWWTQLHILAPNKRVPDSQFAMQDVEAPTLADDMLQTMFAVVLHAQFNMAQWSDDIEPYLAQVISNMLEGDLSEIHKIESELLSHEAEQLKGLAKLIISQSITIAQLSSQVAMFMRRYSPKYKNLVLKRLGFQLQSEPAELEEVFKDFWSLVEAPEKVWPKFVGALCYGAGALMLLSTIFLGQNLNPAVDLQIGLVSSAMLIKSLESVLASRMGRWMFGVLAKGSAEVQTFGQRLSFWFTKTGIEPEGWAVKLFGRNSAEFFATRLAPAIALVTLVVCALMLATAVASGSVSAIVFESLNTAIAAFAALTIAVEVVGESLLGLSAATVAWAGPVGLAIAFAGIVVALVQIIYDLINPPKPPPSPVEKYVHGPLREAGFVKD